MRFAARVEYDGTGFAGFQAQPGRRTVQGELEAALRSISGRRIRVDGAGRTDAGVHASGQVIAFTWDGRRIPATELGRAVRALLPRDVSIGPLRRVATGFQPRRDAVRRDYRYTIWNGPRSPLRERYALGIREALDVPAMDRAAQLLIGRHDFSAFGGKHRRSIRTLYGVRVRRQGRVVTVDVAGDAFLRQMVRSIVAALLRIGHGKGTRTDLEAALASRDRVFDGQVAPPHGLCLRRVVLGEHLPVSIGKARR